MLSTPLGGVGRDIAGLLQDGGRPSGGDGYDAWAHNGGKPAKNVVKAEELTGTGFVWDHFAEDAAA